MKHVAICSTGIANIASVIAGFKRLGAETHLTEDPAEIRGADFVMLPGVGNFGAGMERLDALGLKMPIKERIESGAPTMAICLGLQLLGRSSEEAAGVAGLGVIDHDIVRFPPTVRVPQFGWNKVTANDLTFLEEGWAYFANSYCLRECPDGWRAAWADYAGPFVAAMEREHVLACQFHPELSGAWGLDLMRRWLEA